MRLNNVSDALPASANGSRSMVKVLFASRASLIWYQLRESLQVQRYGKPPGLRVPIRHPLWGSH